MNNTSIIKELQARQQNTELMNYIPQSFEEQFTNTLSDNTRMVYIGTIKEFFGVDSLNDISKEDMQAVTPDLANAWALYMKNENGLSEQTINRKLSALHNFYNFLCRRNVKIMDYNPFATSEGCIRFKVTKNYSDQKTLSNEEIIALANYKKDSTELCDLRNRCMMLMLVTMGLRRSELVSIKVNDIKKDAGRYIVTIKGKGGKYRKLEIATEVYLVIRQYLEKRGVTNMSDDKWLFVSLAPNRYEQQLSAQSVRLVLKDICKAIGLDDEAIHPHTLRHTYATTIFMQELVDHKTLQDLMGHTNLNTTNRYINATKTIVNSPSGALAKQFLR